MKFGLLLPVQHPANDSLAERFDEVLEFARAAQASGFNSLWAAQHFVAAPYQMLQPFPVLARVAGEVDGMTLGSGILLLAFFQPVVTAEEVATLDTICAGRFVFGVGLGYRTEEMDAGGLDRRQCVGRLEEALEVIPRLWTQERVSFEGDYFRFGPLTLSIKPVQQPRPPIWMGANARPAIRRAARLADAWIVNPHASLATLDEEVVVYREELKACGKPEPAEFPIMRELFIAPTRKAAIEAGRPYLSQKYATYQSWGQDEVMDARDSFAVGVDQMLEDRFIVGDPAYCIDKITEYHERLGVNHFIFRVQWPGMAMQESIQALRLCGEKVISKFN